MAQETSTQQWDLRYVNTPMRLDDKLFIFLMLAVLVVVGIKLVRTLRLSRASRQGNLLSPATYRDSLQKIGGSLGQWLLVPLFAWGILASHHLYILCQDLLAQRNIHVSVPLYDLRELAVELYLSLIVSLLAFLVRWNVLKRLERLHP